MKLSLITQTPYSKPVTEFEAGGPRYSAYLALSGPGPKHTLYEPAMLDYD